MRAILAIAKRETAAYFASPLGWIVLFAFMIMWGYFYVSMLSGYMDATASSFSPDMAEQVNVNDYVIQPFFGNLAVIALLVSPALTMRLIAEDRRQRSIELLLTSPVSAWEIVFGKFAGAMGFILVAMVFSLHFPGILYWLGEPDTNVLLCNYLAFLLVNAVFMATGLFFSSLTENQIVALVLAFAFNLIIWVFSWAGQGMSEGTAKTIFEYTSMITHIEKLGKGTIHLESVTYFVTYVGLFLFAAVQRVEALRWR